MGNEISRLVVLSSSTAIAISGLILLLKRYGDFDVFSSRTKEVEKYSGTASSNGLPPGLYNHGNLCFVNATLQALAAVNVLKFTLFECTNAHYEDNDLVLISSLTSLLSELSASSIYKDSAIANMPVLDALFSHGWVISHNQQQDAHEFLHILLSTMEEELNPKKASKDHLFINDIETQPKTIASKSGLRNHVPISKWTSPFQGTLANLLTCLRCGHQFPVKFELFESVPMTCRASKPGNFIFERATLACRLKEFTAKEAVHSVSCPSCAKQLGTSFRGACVKRLMFAKLPKCLCLYFPRTQVNNHGVPFKDSTHISFPEMLDVSEYSFVQIARQASQTSRLPQKSTDASTNGTAISSVKQKIKKKSLYKLQAVVVHSGQVDDGHFVAYRRFSTNDKDIWLLISDASVTTSTLESCLSSIAYMLFYEKQ